MNKRLSLILRVEHQAIGTMILCIGQRYLMHFDFATGPDDQRSSAPALNLPWQNYTGRKHH